jgi:transposase-like protein
MINPWRKEVAMSAKKLKPEEKLQIVLEGIREGKISALCRRYNIHPSDYHRWKEQIFKKAKEIFNHSQGKKDPEIERLQKEKERLEETLLDLTCEVQLLKKRVD